MLTPDDGGNDGKTKAEWFPARTPILRFCGPDLRFGLGVSEASRTGRQRCHRRSALRVCIVGSRCVRGINSTVILSCFSASSLGGALTSRRSVAQCENAVPRRCCIRSWGDRKQDRSVLVDTAVPSRTWIIECDGRFDCSAKYPSRGRLRWPNGGPRLPQSPRQIGRVRSDELRMFLEVVGGASLPTESCSPVRS
jgi:hypothetical protein